MSVEAMDEVQDSLCIAQRNKENTEERVVLFVKLCEGSEFDAALIKSIQTKIRQLLSARHVPAVILETTDIPVSNAYFNMVLVTIQL